MPARGDEAVHTSQWHARASASRTGNRGLTFGNFPAPEELHALACERARSHSCGGCTLCREATAERAERRRQQQRPPRDSSLACRWNTPSRHAAGGGEASAHRVSTFSTVRGAGWAGRCQRKSEGWCASALSVQMCSPHLLETNTARPRRPQRAQLGRRWPVPGTRGAPGTRRNTLRRRE
jgi:hypothetical protein